MAIVIVGGALVSTGMWKLKLQAGWYTLHIKVKYNWKRKSQFWHISFRLIKSEAALCFLLPPENKRARICGIC